MKPIYSETVRENYRAPFRSVRAYHPEPCNDERCGLPALICLEVGHCDSDRARDEYDLVQWSIVSSAYHGDYLLFEAKVIRKAQEILAGGTFEELARKYCFELGWIEPRKL